jgi:hypothetical protein
MIQPVFVHADIPGNTHKVHPMQTNMKLGSKRYSCNGHSEH